MTDREIKVARKQLPARTQVPWKDWTLEQQRLDKELDCRDMINSILCYDGPERLEGNRYLVDYIKELGAETVSRLCEEQVSDFEKSVVLRNIHVDNDGLSYNSIVWADDVPLEERLASANERSEHFNDASVGLNVNILQVKNGDEGRFYRYTSLRSLENGVDSVELKNYDNVYSYSTAEAISLEDAQHVNAFLEGVHAKFNLERPADFKGRSLSVSDVVVVSKGNDIKAYYCDSFGFQELPEKFVDDFIAETELRKDDCTIEK